MRTLIALFLTTALIPPVLAGEATTSRDAATGWNIYTLRQGATIVRVVLAAGANAFSIVHDGVEYLHVPKDLSKLPGVGYGTPILYPTPNRVRDAKFSFDGKTYRFPANSGGNFIHGLVHSEAFETGSTQADDDSVEITCRLEFAPGRRPYELFPFKHEFRVKIRVREGSVRWTYEVDNRQGDREIPFGVALHPYVVYQNARKDTYLRVPAEYLMESQSQLPSGKLLALDGHRLDARQPISLEEYAADDVFFGMRPDRPARVEFRHVGRSITFRASQEFTHLVVWTPDRPYFGIENQTCSTDAHNLASQGFDAAAHLQVCRVGDVMTGSVKYCIQTTIDDAARRAPQR